MPNASTTKVSSASETTGTPIPLSYGFVWATGKRAAYFMTQDTNNTHTDYWRVGMWLLGHGEWDGCNELWINDQLIWTSENDDTDQFHFHRGSDSIIGSGMTPNSIGPDQGVDTFWPVFPPAINPLHYNRIAYYSIFRKQPIENQTNDHQGDPTQWTDVNPIGLWRALRTRLFDDQGRMAAYAFNTNPAWHFVDALLRRKIMPDYNIDLNKGPDDLTTAVRARFNWESIYESAQYFDQLLANGRRRFSGSYSFATQTTLQAVLEQILLCCRSYMQEYAGQIYLICDMPRPSIFTFNRQHILPGSWEASDRNLHTVANRYIGKFRDVLVPAAAQIASITCAGHADNPVVTTAEPHPFALGDYVVIGGTNSAYDGQWTVAAVPTVINAGTPQEIDPTTLTLTSKGSNYPASIGAGGSMGLMYSRFANRSPEFWHKKNQLARGAVGNGIPRWQNKVKQELDFATSTYDQVSRITRYERDRQLGLDQAPYVTPPNISFRTSMFAKDANNNLVCAIQPGDHVTLDDTLNYPYAGEYEVLEPLTVYPPTVQASPSQGGLALTPNASSGEIDFTLGPYNEAVMYDSSDDLQAGWPSVPGSDAGNESDYIGIPLADGMLAFFAGALTSGSTFQLPATGFNPANTMCWAGPAGYKEAGHVMHVISECDVDSNFQLTLNYEDGEGNIWTGDVNFACVAWRSAATPTTSGAWTWIELTLAGGEVICFGKAIVADGTTIPLPAGFTAAQSMAIAFPHDASPNEPGAGGNEAHGVAAYVDSSHVVHLNYQDGESHVWHGNASVLVFAWKNNMGTVTTSTANGVTAVTFPVQTASPLANAFTVWFGRLANGTALPIATQDEASYMQAITSPSSFTIVDHPAHGVGACYLDSNYNVVCDFDDGEGNLWSGGADVFLMMPYSLVNVKVTPPVNMLPRGLGAAASATPQIVLDPDFVDGTQHWSFSAGWQAGTAIFGAQLVDATANSNADTIDKLSVTPGSNYVLSAWFNGFNPSDPAAGSAFCYLKFFDTNGNQIGEPAKGSAVSAAQANAPGAVGGTSTIQGAIAPAGAAYCLAGIEIDPPSAGVSAGSWNSAYVNGHMLDLANQDGLPDGPTFGRTLGVSLSGGYPRSTLVFGGVHSIKGVGDPQTLDYDNEIAENPTPTYKRMPSTNLDANRRALIDFSQGGHLGKNTGNISETAGLYFAGEHGADITGNHTANDAENLNGVAAHLISPISNLMPAQAGADVTSQNKAKAINVPDARSVNELPSWYRALGVGVYSEFKQQSVIGGPGSSSFVTLYSEVQWIDTTGGPIVQWFTDSGTNDTYKRSGTADDSAWSAWIRTQAGADVTGQNTSLNTSNVGNQPASTVAGAATAVLLQNPNFAAGDVGWSKNTGWSIVAGSNPVGGGYVAEFNSSTPETGDPLVNLQNVSVNPGDVLTVSAIVDGTAGTAGQMQISIIWQGVTRGDGNGVASGSDPTQSRYSGVCPAGCTIANICAHPNGAAGTWKIYGFKTAILPNSLADVPDNAANNRYAATDPTSDQTINRFQSFPLKFPSSNVTAPSSTQTNIATIAVESTSTQDIFTIWAIVYFSPAGYSGSILANVDGGSPFGSGQGISPIAFIGTVSGLSPGSHNINLTFIGVGYAATLAASGSYGIMQQIAASNGFVYPPFGSTTVVKPAVR